MSTTPTTVRIARAMALCPHPPSDRRLVDLGQQPPNEGEGLQDICAFHDADDPVAERICGYRLPCPEHAGQVATTTHSSDADSPSSSSTSTRSSSSSSPASWDGWSRKVELRAPHRATRTVVESEGAELVRRLYCAFDEYNALYFDGALGEPLILMTFTSPRALGDHQHRDVHGLQSVIRLHPKTMRRGEAFSRDVLLHEMVHVWQGEILGDLEGGYRGHGPRFAEKCNAIGRELELPQVGVKGRKGLPDCAGWPVNIRPAGFYGDEGAEAKRRKRLPRPAEEPEQPPRDDAEAHLPSTGGPDARAQAALVCLQAAHEAAAAGEPRRVVDALYKAGVYLRDSGVERG